MVKHASPVPVASTLCGNDIFDFFLGSHACAIQATQETTYRSRGCILNDRRMYARQRDSGPGGRFASSAPSNSAQCWSGHTVGDPQPSPHGGASNVSRVISACGKAVGVPVRGVPEKGGDMDGVLRALCAPSRAGHRNDHGGGQPSITMVPLLCHSGAVGGPKQPPPQHRPVHQGGGAEVVQAGSRGGQSRHIKGL